MAACEVSQVVASILSAYNSGLEVFKKLKCRKKSRSSSKDTKTAQEEALLQSSLQRRPQDISHAYASNVALLGHRFEIGDTIAHSSLAHTLLVLNSGLINVLSNSLSEDSIKRKQSRRSLLIVSEVAAADALYALEQLNRRLTSFQPKITASGPLQITDAEPTRTGHSRKPSKTVVDITIDPKVKSRAENNLLVRGGWVRPRPPQTRSGSSVVATGSSRNANVVKSADHKRSKTRTASLTESNQGSKGSPRLRHSRTQSTPVPPTQPTHIAEPSSDSNSQYRPYSPDMLLVPSDFFDSQTGLPPPRPPKIPLHSRPSVSTRPSTGIRPRPPSVATFMTASTKIGEIPEHRWPDRIPRTDEELRPMPYTIPPPLNVQDVTPRKRKGFRFWKKSEPVSRSVVY